MPATQKIFLLWLTVFSIASMAAGITVTYPAKEVETDSRFNDLPELLKMALDKTEPEFGPYVLQPSAYKMNEARYLFELKRHSTVNVVWSATSIEKEKDFLPLRIPLRKGLLGYRVMLIPKNLQARIDQIKTVEDLKQLKIGQGLGWGDVQLYRSNGLSVTEASYDSLFRMTSNNLIDIFPRGVGEIIPEYQIYAKANPNLAIEKNLLIYYPWPYYFFFNKADSALKTRIEAGLNIMIKDGSFDAIFKKYNHGFIDQLKLKSRRVITIKNDSLPKETPLNDPSLWFDPVKN